MSLPGKNPIVIELRGLGKRFGSHWVLSHLDLTVHAGEVVALFGRNGSGKSTLLKILATLLVPTCGSCKILGGQELREMRKSLRILGHAKQLYTGLTVLENLQLTAAIRGEGASDCELSLQRLGMYEARHRKVAALSEGMKKRVVLAKLLLGKESADLILLDEPHPALDVAGRKILGELLTNWRQEGKTILLASHDHEQVLTHVDRLLVLEQGRIGYDGPPSMTAALAEVKP